MNEEALALLKKIGDGSEQAIADFYRLFEARLYKFIRSKLNDSFEAYDILNETFLEVWHKAHTFEGRSKVSTWLFGIAYYKTMDRLRKKKPELLGEEDFSHIADDTPGAVAELISADNAKGIKHCLGTLKPAHRAVMELAFFEEMPYSEISAIVDCPENTVKTRMFHAKQAMKHCLQKCLGDTV